MADPSNLIPQPSDNIDVNALLQQATDDYAPFKASPSDIAGDQARQKQDLATERDLAAKEMQIGNEEFTQPTPKQDTNLLSGIAPLMLFTAFGGKSTKINAMAMLSGTTGMVKGYLSGKQEQYEESMKQYQQAYQQFKDRQAQQLKVYDAMRSAYAGQADAEQKAIETALRVTGDEWTRKVNVIDMWQRQRQFAAEIDRYNATINHQDNQDKIALQKLQLEQQKYQPSITPDAARTMAQRMLNGEDPSKVVGPLGRGTQGAANIALVDNWMESLRQEKGITPEQIAQARQKLTAYQRAMTVIGQREGSMAIGLGEVQQFGPMAILASTNVPRTDWEGLNKVLQYAAEQASDPQLAKFQAANQAFANAYATVIGRGNSTNTVAAQNKAYDLLSTAAGPEAYKAKVQQLTMEAEAASKVPLNEMEAVSQQEFPQGGGGQPAAAPAAGTPSQAPTAYMNGRKIIVKNGAWVYEDTGEAAK